jgi:hypothetical protein
MHSAGEDDDNRQSSKEILLSAADRLEEVQLPELALRLALRSHIRVPNENEIDHLVEGREGICSQTSKEGLTAKKKTVKNPAPPKGKTATKKATKRIASQPHQWPSTYPRGTTIQFTERLGELLDLFSPSDLRRRAF